MKLELKHLAPYLPYSLKLKFIGDEFINLQKGKIIYDLEGFKSGLMTTQGNISI